MDYLNNEKVKALYDSLTNLRKEVDKTSYLDMEFCRMAVDGSTWAYITWSFNGTIDVLREDISKMILDPFLLSSGKVVYTPILFEGELTGLDLEIGIKFDNSPTAFISEYGGWYDFDDLSCQY